MHDAYYMDLALSIAEVGRFQTTPNPMVGAVIVKDGVIVGQGAHLKAGGPHAEIHALRMAGEQAQGATMYVTLEPCSHYGRTPPCADAVIQSGIRRVVIAMEDMNPVVRGQGIERLQSAGIDVTVGVSRRRAYQINELFFTWVKHQRPFVVWKCAATLDGYIATTSGDSKYVTSEDARETVQEIRRSLPAIAVGIQTVLADNPRLTVRQDGHQQPTRVIFDSHLRFPQTAQMLSEPGKTLIYTVLPPEQIEASALYQNARNLDIVSIQPDEQGHVSLPHALQDMGKRGLTGVLVEGGSQIVSSLLRDELIDKVIYYLAPKILGGGVPALSGLQRHEMHDASRLYHTSWSTVGPDLRVEGYLRENQLLTGGD